MNMENPKSIPLIRPERLKPSFWKRLRRFLDDLRSQFSRDPLDRCRWVRFPSTLQNTSERSKDQLGRAGEEEAAILLREKGYVLLQQNLRFPEGELDIVARSGPTLVFVEVKTRRRKDQGAPYEAVSFGKQKRQIAAAQRFISECGLRKVTVRFDVVSIHWPKDGPPEIEHWENAYRPQDVFFRF